MLVSRMAYAHRRMPSDDEAAFCFTLDCAEVVSEDSEGARSSHWRIVSLLIFRRAFHAITFSQYRGSSPLPGRLNASIQGATVS